MTQELDLCWWDGEGASMSRVGHSGVRRITLEQDGNGPMGLYDRIHVYNENGAHLVFPAHLVSGWRLADEPGVVADDYRTAPENQPENMR